MTIAEVQELNSRASYGSIDSAIKLFDYYCENDPNKAFLLINRFSDSKSPDILKRFAKCYSNGIGVKQDLNEANKFNELALDNGDLNACFRIANYYYKIKKYSDALPYLIEGKFNNQLNCIKMLGEFYYKGLAVYPDLKVALNLYLNILKNDDTVIFNICKIYEELKDYLNLVKYLNLGVECHDIKCIYLLTKMYLEGNGVPANYQKAVSLLEKGSSLGSSKCSYQLSLLYKNGIGVIKDRIKEEMYYSLSLKQKEK